MLHYLNNTSSTKKITIVILTLFFPLLIMTWILLQNVEQAVRLQAVNVLKTVLASNHTSIRDVWLNERLSEVEVWASNPDILQSTKKLIAIRDDPAKLRSSPELKKIRSYFEERLAGHNDYGMFIISSDYVNLASMYDDTLGEVNLVSQQKRQLLDEVFTGKVKITGPMVSDIPLPGLTGEMEHGWPTMFVLYPMKDKSGSVISALSIRIDPIEKLSKVMQRGFVGSSGESYIVDGDGRMISNSRFSETLRKLKLIEKNQTSILNLEILDPGGDLTGGYKPLLPRHELPFTYMAKNIVFGVSGSSHEGYRDYRGIYVLGAWLWDETLGMGFVTEMDEEEAMYQFEQQRRLLLLILFTFIIFTILFTILLRRSHYNAKEKLQRSEEYLRSVMETAADAIITINEEGKIKTINTTGLNMFKYSADELVGKNIKLLMPDGYAKLHDNYLKHYNKYGVKKIIGSGRELEAVRKDGFVFPVRLAVSETYVNGKRIFTGVIQDLSVIERSKKALRESEDKFRHFFEDSRDAVIILNDQGIVDCNEAAVEMFCVDRKETLLNIKLNSLSPVRQATGEASDELLDKYFSHALENKGTQFEWLCLKATGVEFFTEISLSFIELEDRSLVQAIVRDVSVRKATEKVLQQRSTELEKTIHELDKARITALSMMEDAEVEKRKAQEANQALDYRVEFEKLISELSTGFISLKVDDIDNGIESSLEKLARFSNSDSGVVFEFADDNEYFSLCHHWSNEHFNIDSNSLVSLEMSVMPWWMNQLLNGETIFVVDTEALGEKANVEKAICLQLGIKSLINIPMSFEENVIGFIGFWSANKMHHWTENEIVLFSMASQMIANALHRQKSEQALVGEKIKADEASRAKSDFLARMSHEIRTPMNAIMGMTYLALKQELSPKVRDYLVKSNQSANSLLGVINDILDFSKIEAGKLNIENIDFELEVVIANVLNLVSMDADKKNIEIILSIAPDVPVSIIGDPMRLEQVLTNIVNNAVKFTETGEIVVAVRVLSRGQDNNVRLNFRVKDTGIGMSESQLTGLFREFSQADGSVTRKYGGTGLGLAISQRLVELMGSHIEVESKIDEGSCFSFDLDFSLSNVLRSKKRPLSFNLKGLRCLVVDDNAAAQQVLEEMLTSLGFLVKCVDSGELAINTLEESSPKDDFQLVVVDWKMPGMGGLETIKRIKASNKIKFAPACMMVSIYNHRDIEKVAVDVDADAFLEKPVRPSALFDSIIEIFNKKPLAGSVVHNNDYLNPANKALFSGCKILLAEDNLLNQELANELLLESGADVTVVDNGLDAINACKGTTFDLILMDIQMPDMDGLEATRKIRELEGQKGGKSRDKHVPIVAMTAHAMKGDREKSLDAGMDEHITKPIVPLEFYETLKKWLGKKSEKSESLIGDPNKDKETLTGVDQIISSAKPGNNEWLIDLDGIDTKSGFELNLSDVDFYKRNLQRFHQFSGDSYSGFESAYTNNDLSEAKRFSHSLKSSAAQIGAEDLRQIAQKIETATQAIDNIESIEPLFLQLKTEYERVMNSISVLDEKSTNTPDEFNADKNRSILSTDEFKTAIFRLRDAILRQEFEANIRLEECHEELAECVDRVLVNNLAEALKNFEYQKAMTIFDDIQNKMEFR